MHAMQCVQRSPDRLAVFERTLFIGQRFAHCPQPMQALDVVKAFALTKNL